MTKKRKRYPDLNQKLERPWCYYCERDFDDLKILISHQKAKHFKCDRCGRRLNTAGGLSVHMNQVHKENLTHVENANPGRQGLEIEIFGMEGVPAEIIDQHVQQVTQAHFAEEQERARITGNPIRGAYGNGDAPPNKRPKVNEDLEDIEKRAGKYREDRKNGILPMPVEARAIESNPTPPALQQAPYAAPAPFQTPAYAPLPTNGGIPPRPGSIPSALPPRPTPSAYPPPDALQAQLDAITAGAAKEAPAEKSDDKKPKKDKNMRLIFHDVNVSPEEKTARLPRFAEFMRT
ncbi:hypothetical protein CC86DRAFT_329912 [Ophiobolus disseminans]|uniref:C2H2-type domain-containing protein n=1 Tax=Ophiobolus disseminans TaxID=1469910 RepID=A0A6A6ZMQ6_9PLEO|nr:hypothetical protein CC86DRAFT_329912 [Ophiobolus disseminans]